MAVLASHFRTHGRPTGPGQGPARMPHRIAFVLACLLTLPVPDAPAQPAASPSPAPSPRSGRHPEEGRPLVRTYRPADVAGDGQNWAIVQDARGVLYAGSASGVLEFDGVTWRLIETPLLSTVRSLAITSNGEMYAGSVADFGRIDVDDRGQRRFVSLRDKLPAGAPAFGDVWRTLATPQGVVFQANAAIFRWDGTTMHVVRPASTFARASEVDGRIYVVTPEAGLNVLEGDALRAQPGTASLAAEPFPVVLRYDARRLLIATREHGLYLYDGAALVPFRTEVEEWLRTAAVYRGATLPDGNIALVSTRAGLVLLGRDGRHVLTVNQDMGLFTNQLYNLAVDREGALWLAMAGGIARVDVPSPVSVFDTGGIAQMVRHEGRFYIATNNGVTVLQPGGGATAATLRELPDVQDQCWWFEKMPALRGAGLSLYLACTTGLHEVRDGHVLPTPVVAPSVLRPATLLRSRVDPSRLWVGLFQGLASLRWVDGRIVDEGRIAEVPNEVRSLAEGDDGSLFAGTLTRGIAHVRFSARPSEGAARPAVSGVRFFGPSDGMDEVSGVVRHADGVLGIGVVSNTMARYDSAMDRFVKDPALSGLPFDKLRVGFGVYAAPDGALLLNSGKGTTVARRSAAGTWDIDGALFSRFGAQPAGALLVEPDRVAWFEWRDSLIRFDLARAAALKMPSSVLVRRVTVDRDRLLYGGGAPPAAQVLPAGTEALRFEFASPTYLDETATQYQTRLDGLETEWSPWSTDARRDFTNLSLGTYLFRVRSRGVTGAESEEATYAFSILPPWYRTWWAYALYVAAAALLVAGAARVMRHRVVSKERERAQFAEARLRAEAAEQLAATETEGKKQVELLSDIGREITSSLDIDTIFGKLYERVNQLADADVFGVGLYHPEQHEIEYRLAIEDGKRYAPYTRDTTDTNQLPVWCLQHRRPVLINDLAAEHGRYVSKYDEQSRRLEDGSMSKTPQSIIYVPLLAQDRALGVITIQSFERGAYDEHHLNVLQSLASYTAVALDNASAYRQLNEQEHEIRRLFEAAELARAAAEEADAAKSAFLSTVSHELRTPLTSVLGFAKIIKKRLEDRIFPLVPTDDRRIAQTIQQVDDNLRVVVSEGERLTKLIDDVLDLAKIEAGKLEWHMGEVSIADVIDHATAATASLFEPKGLRLVKEVAADLPLVTGDRDRLIQVVINLISNAVKFTDHGTVTCRAVRDGSALVVSVIDTGVGITPSDQPKVFERFKQVGDTLTDKPKGTGLGLPICKEIVEHHGGRIWVESAIGAGSTFAFSVPMTGAAAAAAAGPVELAALIRQLRDQVVVTTPRTAERTPRILIVDDEANIRELLTQEFVEAGYAVATAANGREAVARVRSERPDLIVLDVMMPEMNGFDVAAVLKNDPATLDIPIVILSIVQDRDRGYRVGVDRYLTKPIDTDLLFREVGALIEQKKSHKRVLVVDEDASTVKTLSDVLSTRGYSVVEASGDDLVERAVAMQPDIILLNAVASGSQAVRTLRFEKGLEHVLFLVYQ